MINLTYDISLTDVDGVYVAVSTSPEFLVSSLSDITLRLLTSGGTSISTVTVTLTDGDDITIGTATMSPSTKYKQTYTTSLSDILTTETTTDLYRYYITFSITGVDPDDATNTVTTLDNFRVYDSDTVTALSTSDVDMLFAACNDMSTKINALSTRISALEVA